MKATNILSLISLFFLFYISSYSQPPDPLDFFPHHIGDKFFAVDQAIIHTSHADVKKLMHIEPQLRGNDLGIIRILAPSYLLNNPLSLGMNGTAHAGARALFAQAIPGTTVF